MSPERAELPLLRDSLHQAALPPRQRLQGDGQGCEPLRLADSEASPAWRQCVRMRGTPAHSLRAVLSLVEKKPGSCALRRAASWTAVSLRPAQDHHEHEDPVDGAGR